MKILISDDDQFYRKIYKHKFELLKYEVELAENGEEALEKIKTFKPDIVLLDIMMPKMNGYDTLDAMHKDEEMKDIPVIMLTNLSSGQDTSVAKEKGAKALMIKSDVTPDEVVEKVEKVLASK
jgi:CheY-like chemotaxis protein